MWIEFDRLPGQSRVWIFPLVEAPSEMQLQTLNNGLQTFIQDWTSHNHSLHGSGLVLQDRFAVIAIDEAQLGASGCSIDKLMRFIQNMEGELGIPLLLKTKIGIQRGETLRFYALNEIKDAIRLGELSATDKYFDLLIQEKSELTTNWLKPLSEGWLSKKLFN